VSRRSFFIKLEKTAKPQYIVVLGF
jgi:hypothetical protein